MTEQQPTNADILAAISSLTTAVAAMSETQRLHGQAMSEGFDRLGADVVAVKADVAAVKADTTSIHRYVAELQDSLHIHRADPNAHGQAA